MLLEVGAFSGLKHLFLKKYYLWTVCIYIPYLFLHSQWFSSGGVWHSCDFLPKHKGIHM